MDNPETQATLNTRHRTKENKTKKTHYNTENYKKKKHGTHTTGMNPGAGET